MSSERRPGIVPGAVRIARSSSPESTTVTPVAVEMSVTNPSVRTPAPSSASRTNRPNRSSPMTAAIATRRPSFAAPCAKIAPEPPSVSVASSTRCSAWPNAGTTSPPRSTRSGLASPSTSRSRSTATPEPYAMPLGHTKRLRVRPSPSDARAVPRIELVVGDITEADVDAVVNAANSSLLGGSGVDGAIHRRGGPAILEACRALRDTTLPDGLPVGEAVATTAGDLPAQWVIHTVGPVYGRTKDDAALLAACHRSSLRVADEIGATAVAFPAISTGAFGYPIDAAARVAIAAVQEASTAVEEV